MAEAAKFKSGDIVQLNSGGPRMVVDWAAGNQVACAWFGENSKLEGEVFPDACVKLVPEE